MVLRLAGLVPMWNVTLQSCFARGIKLSFCCWLLSSSTMVKKCLFWLLHQSALKKNHLLWRHYVLVAAIIGQNVWNFRHSWFRMKHRWLIAVFHRVVPFHVCDSRSCVFVMLVYWATTTLGERILPTHLLLLPFCCMLNSHHWVPHSLLPPLLLPPPIPHYPHPFIQLYISSS